MKNQSISSLNWSNVLKSKAARLGEHVPVTQADNNSSFWSDSRYGDSTQNHPIQITDDQAMKLDNEPSARLTASPCKTAVPSEWVFRRTDDQTLKVKKYLTLKLSRRARIQKR